MQIYLHKALIILSVNESGTNTIFSVLYNLISNFSNIAMTWKSDSMHYPIICQSSKGSADPQDLMVFITEYNVRFFVRVLQN